MQSNDPSYDAYDYGAEQAPDDDGGVAVTAAQLTTSEDNNNFEDPRIANLPKILLMGPRRGGKSSIQVCIYLHIYNIHTLSILLSSIDE